MMNYEDGLTYWENEANGYYADKLKNLDRDITMSDLRHLEKDHIYAALFREIDVECPDTTAVAIYCWKAIALGYCNEIIADKWLPEAYEIFDEMFWAGFCENEDHLAKEMEKWGGKPSDHEGNPEIRKAVYQHYYEEILVALNLNPSDAIW